MADPGYVTIPLSAEAGAVKPTSTGSSSSSGPGMAAAGGSPRRSATAADRWKFGRSADKKFLSPVVVSKTMYKLMERIANGSTATENEFHLLPFTMASNRSPIVGQYRPANRKIAWQDSEGDVISANRASLQELNCDKYLLI